MASARHLRGACFCGRNHYTVNLPEDRAGTGARVLFDTDPRHRLSQASLVASFLRVPLSWYRSGTVALREDEVPTVIRRTYIHPSQQHTKRGFCGFCGTPLSYWTEDPPTEANFIRLTLGSLHRDDLGDLEDLGLVPGSDDGQDDGGEPASRPSEGGDAARGGTETGAEADAAGPARHVVARETSGVPWFDSLVAGSRLGSLRQSWGGGQSGDGRMRYEWEVVEWTAGDDEQRGSPRPKATGQPSPTKRLKQDDGEHGGRIALKQ